jgi:ABC-type nitrate/sulfonate/bicarbonate transport system permease component
VSATTAYKTKPSRLRVKLIPIVYAVTLPAVLLTGWAIASASSTELFFPPLSTILAEFGPTWFEGRFVDQVLPSVSRLLSGFVIALAVGVGLGIGIGRNPKLRAFLEPGLEFFRAIPPSVLIPVLMLFMGIGDQMKVFVIVFGSIWPVLLNTVEGTRAIDEVLRDTALVYRFRKRTRLTKLVLRGASPQIMAGAGQSLSLAVILMVISEMFAANNGLGFTIVQFQRNFAVAEMWTGIILLGILGVLLSLIFRAIEHITLRWYQGLRRTEKGS